MPMAPFISNRQASIKANSYPHLDAYDKYYLQNGQFFVSLQLETKHKQITKIRQI